jgi:carboxymethylenebutenolidase
MGDALQAETIEITGHEGASLEAYFAKPLDEARRGGVVVIHHMPGYDEGSKEITRRFAAHGYLAVCPNLYSRLGHGRDPAEAAAENRQRGGVPDEQLLGDVEGAVRFLRGLHESNGKVATIGYCSGGRQSLLAACSIAIDAAVDCYGGFVVRDPPPDLNLGMRPILHLVEGLRCPLLGLFGVEDANPSPDDVAEMRKALEAAGKEFEFHSYENAGHAFFAVDRAMYRPEAALKGWAAIWDFFGRTLA